MLSSFFITLILLGALQGFIISILLFVSKKNKQANRLLSALIFFISLACFNLYGNYKDWFGSDWLRFFADLIPLVVAMPIGPLIYFYIRSSIDTNFILSKKDRKHFYPVIVDLVPSVIVLIYFIGLITGLFKNNPGPWGNFIDTYNVYADIPRWLSITLYLWQSRKFLSAYKAKHVSLNGHANNFKWLQLFTNIFLVFQCIWFIYLVPYVIPRYTNMILDTFDWYPIYIPLAIMIYWLGIKGYIVSQQEHTAVKKTAPSTTLSADTINQIIAVLKRSMEEDKLYLDPNLNLGLLSEKTAITQKNISAVLNQYMYKSFNEFVNEYRVAAFKEKILQSETEHLTIAGVAFECGFSSQATFQRTFKQITGMSPSEFRNMAIQTQ